MTNLTFEERRVGIEERRVSIDRDIRKRELELKEKEGSWPSKLMSPLTIIVFASVLILLIFVGGTMLHNRQVLELEREKFRFTQEQAVKQQQNDLIVKLISVGDIKHARETLLFLAEAGLIGDRSLAVKMAKLKAASIVP